MSSKPAGGGLRVRDVRTGGIFKTGAEGLEGGWNGRGTRRCETVGCEVLLGGVGLDGSLKRSSCCRCRCSADAILLMFL